MSFRENRESSAAPAAPAGPVSTRRLLSSGDIDALLSPAANEGDVDVRIELGRRFMRLDEMRSLGGGSVGPLDALADEPVNLYVDERLVARADVLVLDGNLCARIVEVLPADHGEAR